MRTLLKLFLAAVLVAAIAGVAVAADVEGILLDRMCSPKLVKAGQQAALAHTRECNLMPDCVKAGFGVLTADGKFITLDPAGNKMAVGALKASKLKDSIRVKVTGEQTGDAMKVASLKIL
jgi:hypothetical protein